MWRIPVLIIWAAYFVECSSPDAEHASPSTILQNITSNVNETVTSNIHLMETDSFSQQMVEILTKKDFDDRLQEMQALLSRSNLTIEDYQKQVQRKMRLDGTIGSAFRNRLMLLQNSSIRFDDEKPDQEFSIGNVRIPFDIYGNESTIERQAYLRALDYVYERKKSIARMILSWLSDYCRYPNSPDPEGEGTWITFADISMEDSIIAPEGINWVICSTTRNAKIEILERLSRPTYPLPIREKAGSSAERLSQNFPKLNADCIPTAWSDLPVMYFNENVEPQFTILQNLVSTSCSC